MTLVNFMFQCQNCEHSTEIYFETQFYPNEVFVEGNCSSCQQYLLLNNGDMGYRSDYPDPMYPPWQLQCVGINPAKRYCADCAGKQAVSVQDAEPLCTGCDNVMIYQSIGTGSEKASLQIILNWLYKDLQ